LAGAACAGLSTHQDVLGAEDRVRSQGSPATIQDPTAVVGAADLSTHQDVLVAAHQALDQGMSTATPVLVE
jgi:hypothetical protein